MVCAQEVFAWFKDLSGYQRIEVMCGLLHLSSPIELRFYGTCVEDLAKRDYHYLREAERRANAAAELNALGSSGNSGGAHLGEATTRSKLIISLALLQSSNHVCANVIFKSLLAAVDDADDRPLLADQDEGDQQLLEETLLMLTMAFQHPAFTYAQKTSVESRLNPVKERFHKPQPQAGGSLPRRQDFRQEQEYKNEPVTHAATCVHLHSPSNRMAFVKDLSLKKMAKKKGEKRSELKIQVTWSSGEATKVIKSYQELFEFSQKLKNLVPGDESCTSSNHQLKYIPFLIAPKSGNGNRSDDINDETLHRISEFFKKIPPFILESEMVAAYFRGQISVNNCPQIAAHMTMPLHSSTQGISSIPFHNAQQHLPSRNNHPNDPNRGKGSPLGIVTPGFNSSALHSVSGPSPGNSPQPSPASSPFTSPSQSGTSSRAASPWTPRANNDAPTATLTLKQIFKIDRLKKYRNKFLNTNVEEIRALSDEDLSKEGLDPVAINCLRKCLENLRVNPPNGLNTHQLDKNILSSVHPPSSIGTSNSTMGSPLIVPSSAASPVNPLGSACLLPSTDHQYRAVSQPAMPQTMSSHIPMMPISSNATMNMQNLQNGSNAQHHSHNSHIQQHPQPFQGHHPQHYQIQPNQMLQQHWAANATETSPSCSEYSSPPGSPALDSQPNNYDSSCSEDIDKDKDVERLSKPADQIQQKHTNNSKARGKMFDNKASSKSGNKQRTEEETNTNPGNYFQPTETGMPVRQIGNDMASVSPVPAAKVPGTSAPFQRPRMNSVSSPSPPGTAVQAFKPGNQHFTLASPVRNNNTIIFENSHYIKTLQNAAVPHPSTVSAHGRWENMNGGSGSMNGSQAQLPSSNMFVISSTSLVTQAPNTSYRTFTTAVSSSVIGTSASRQSVVTTVNMNGLRLHNKMVTGQMSDDALKMNSGHNAPLPPTTACMSNVGQGNEVAHQVIAYPGAPVSYVTLPPSPIAPTSVTYSTPAFLAANNSQNLGSQTSNAITQVQISHGHSALNTMSSGCNNSCGCTCSSSTPPPNMSYSPGFLTPLQLNNTAVFTGFPNFLQTHNTNGFISPTMPNFPFANGHLAAAGALPNGMTTELIYSGSQFPMLQQNGSQHSNAAAPGFMPGPAPNINYHGNFSNPSNQQQPPKNKNVSCFNCGVMGHKGLDCKEATMEEITKPGQFRLNYMPSKSMESTE